MRRDDMIQLFLTILNIIGVLNWSWWLIGLMWVIWGVYFGFKVLFLSQLIAEVVGKVIRELT